MAKSTRSKPAGKPKKPHPDFPLWPHPSGRWCKKVHGGFNDFGKIVDDPKGEAALLLWLDQKDDLLGGRKPRSKDDAGVTLAGIINSYLADADLRKETGDLSPVSFADYQFTGKWIVRHFGRNIDPEKLRPPDFAGFRHVLASKYAPTRVGKMVTVTRMILRWAYDSEIIDQLPRFGPGFKSTSKRAARAAKAEQGEKLFAADHVRQLLAETDGTFSAMILLAMNSGLGNNDLSTLPIRAVDLDAGWINFPRPKTGVMRRIPLWPESVAGLRDVIDSRPQPQTEELADRVFLTSRGGEWIAVRKTGQRTDKITIRFRRLLATIGAAQKGRGFYSLRHTFQTIGDDAGDPLATSAIMGHVDASTAGHYRERISDERLRRVTRASAH